MEISIGVMWLPSVGLPHCCSCYAKMWKVLTIPCMMKLTTDATVTTCDFLITREMDTWNLDH